jgi:hypothetical protein
MFGRKLGDAVDVARLGRQRLRQPGGRARTTFEPVAYRLRNHQRGRRREDEALHAARHRCIEQVERALHVGGDKIAVGAVLDIGLVQRAAVDDGFYAVLADHAQDKVTIGDRADNLGFCRWNGIEADHLMAKRPQARRQRAAQPTRRSREQDSHSSHHDF